MGWVGVEAEGLRWRVRVEMEWGWSVGVECEGFR